MVTNSTPKKLKFELRVWVLFRSKLIALILELDFRLLKFHNIDREVRSARRSKSIM